MPEKHVSRFETRSAFQLFVSRTYHDTNMMCDFIKLNGLLPKCFYLGDPFELTVER